MLPKNKFIYFFIKIQQIPKLSEEVLDSATYEM